MAPEGISCDPRSQAAEESAAHDRWRRQPGIPGRRRLKRDGSRRRRVGQSRAAGYFFRRRRRNIGRHNGNLKPRIRRNCGERCETNLTAERGFPIVARRTAVAVAHVSVGHPGWGHGKGHASHIRRMRDSARGKYREQDNRENADQSDHNLMLSCFRVMSRYTLSQRRHVASPKYSCPSARSNVGLWPTCPPNAGQSKRSLGSHFPVMRASNRLSA
jgi:hypothetical protein